MSRKSYSRLSSLSPCIPIDSCLARSLKRTPHIPRRTSTCTEAQISESSLPISDAQSQSLRHSFTLVNARPPVSSFNSHHLFTAAQGSNGIFKKGTNYLPPLPLELFFKLRERYSFHHLLGVPERGATHIESSVHSLYTEVTAPVSPVSPTTAHIHELAALPLGRPTLLLQICKSYDPI